VEAVLVLPDGSLLLGGWFTHLGGIEANRLCRLTTSGSLEFAFGAGLSAGGVQALARQADGRILVGGPFIEIDSHPTQLVARLNADGTLDRSFALTSEKVRQTESFFVSAVIEQPGYGILVGGSFRDPAGHRNSLLRVREQGDLDEDFLPGFERGAWLGDLLPLSDGRILVGGSFSSVGGQPATSMARLMPDGSRDGAWLPTLTSRWADLEPSVSRLLLQPDGRLVLAGAFATVGGAPQQSVGRVFLEEPFPVGPRILEQPRPQSVKAGADVTLAGKVESYPPPLFQWRFEDRDLPGQTNPVLLLRNVLPENAGLYQLSVVGDSGATSSVPARVDVHPRLRWPGQPVLAFAPDDWAYGSVYAAHQQANGRILVGSYRGSAASSAASFCRLLSDGRRDPSFVVSLDPNAMVQTVACLPDGRVAIGGEFREVNGAVRSG